MNWILLLAMGGLVLAAYCIVFRFLPRLASNHLKAANVGAQTLVAIVTAIGITMAGLLYILERQWSPRFGVEVRTSILAVPDSNPPIALVQVAVSITNQGRVSETVNGIEIAAIGLRPAVSHQLNRYGDMPGKEVARVSSVQPKNIGAGETDLAYAELAIPCSYSVARLTVKVPQPPFRSDAPVGKRQVYQRKVLVPLSHVCSKRGSPQ